MRDIKEKLLMLPGLAGFLLFSLVPFGMTVIYAFIRTPFDFSFIGFDNIVKTVRNDYFRMALGHTVVFTMVSVSLTMLLSLTLTFLYARSGITFHAPLMLPVLLPTVAVALIWKVLFGQGSLLYNIGLGPLTSLYTLFIWKNAGLYVIILLSALSQVLRETLEAAAIDGAGLFRRFRWIILPELAPTILFVCIYAVMNSFRVFREAYLLYGAFPDTSVFMAQHYIYNQFAKLRYPEVASAGLIYAVPVVFLVAVLFCHQEQAEENRV